MGEEARSLFAGELTFPEQCRQQGMCYVELGSGDDGSDVDMLAFVDDMAVPSALAAGRSGVAHLVRITTEARPA